MGWWMFMAWGVGIGMTLITLLTLATGKVRGSNWIVTREDDPEGFRFNVLLFGGMAAACLTAASVMTVLNR